MVVVRITSEVVENTNELSFGERQVSPYGLAYTTVCSHVFVMGELLGP